MKDSRWNRGTKGQTDARRRHDTTDEGSDRGKLGRRDAGWSQDETDGCNVESIFVL